MTLELAPRERQLLSGEAGDGARLARRFLVKAAEIAGAPPGPLSQRGPACIAPGGGITRRPAEEDGAPFPA